MKKLKRGISQTKYDYAKTIIPGGTQLLSKRPELFLPNLWPAYYKKAKGIEIWDLDGIKYRDFTTNGVGSCILGYANDEINLKVKKSIDLGSMSSLNSFEEVDLAESLIKMHPWADQVRFAKTGGEACSIAVRIARAASNKDVILFCGYHGWHDWYLSANIDNPNNLNKQLLSGLSPLGVPSCLSNSTYPFIFNDSQSLKEAFQLHKGKIAGVIMEPIRGKKPSDQFITELKELLKKESAILIIDEVTSGFRENLGGYHLLTNFDPDIAILGKGLGNGYPISAVIGKNKYMKAAENTFISSTFFTERIGFVAAISTLEQMAELNVQKRLIEIGKIIKSEWERISSKYSIDISISGLDPLATFSFLDQKNSLEMMTFFIQEMLKMKFLAGPSYYASFAATDKDISDYLNCFDKILNRISKTKNISDKLETAVKHTTFQRLN